MNLDRNKLLEQLNMDAPHTGKYVAYYRKKVIYEKYDNLQSVLCKVKENLSSLLEIHVFDEEIEVRAIYSNRVKGFIYSYVSQNENELQESDSFYYEIVKGTDNEDLKVTNIITYDENGMIQIRNYRLSIPKEGEN